MTNLHAIINQGNPCVLLARVYDMAGNLIAPSGVESISVSSWNIDTAQEAASFTVSPSGAIYSTLQRDARWCVDSQGYNVAIPITPGAFPAAGEYQVQASLTPIDSDSFTIVARIEAKEVF